MNKLILYTILMLLILLVLPVKAQDDTLKQVFRPRLGIGTGVMTYYGEVQNYQKSFSPTVNRFGGFLYANAPISRMFNVEFSATYAKIAANERTLTRNFNFESRIRMGTVMLYYNFYPLFKANRSRFNPFVGTGFSSFEFLSKTDLFDGAGNMYYYWSDGSIMDMPEDDPLAATNASPLTRDYTYETDLRELNADDLGKYREQSISLPLSLGFQWHMSPRWDFRIAATYHFTFTDLIDNISDAGEGVRKGDPKNDKLLFTTVSLSYDLKFKEDSEEGEGPMMEDDVPLYAEWDPNDFDKDGVIDALDNCPLTPAEALVDEYGCPLDGDGDGIPDYRDDELNTPPDNYVDEYGVTITEEDFIAHAKHFYDSTGYEHDFEEYRTEVLLNKEKAKYYPRQAKTKSGLKYVIVVGSEQKDVTGNDLHKYLSFKDYSSVVKGDTVYYTLGEFNSIEEVVAAKSELESKGVTVESVGRHTSNNEAIIPVDEEVISKVEKLNIEEGRAGPDYTNSEQMFRIQLGAFSHKIDPEEVFPGLDVVYGASEKDNLNRYYTGSFSSYEEAVAFQNKIAAKGYKETFIVAYQQQKRVTLIDAGVDKEQLPENYTEEAELETFVDPIDTASTASNNESLSYDASLLFYRVRLVHVEGDIPVETLDILYNIKNIKPIRNEDGSTTYYSKTFTTKEDRDLAISNYEKYGLEDLTPVIEYKGRYYTQEEFDAEFNQ